MIVIVAAMGSGEVRRAGWVRLLSRTKRYLLCLVIWCYTRRKCRVKVQSHKRQIHKQVHLIVLCNI